MNIKTIINSESDPELKQLFKIIYKIALGFCKHFSYSDIDDLFQAGWEGVEKARENFNDKFKVPFSFYVQFYIRNSIEKYIVDNYFPKTGSLYYNVYKFKKSLDVTCDIEKTKKDLSISSKTSLKYLMLLTKDVEIDSSITDSNYSDNCNDISKDIIFNESIEKIISFLSNLDKCSSNEFLVFVNRFGLCGYEKKTFEEIAKKLSTSKQLVFKIYLNTLKKLKKFLKYQIPHHQQ